MKKKSSVKKSSLFKKVLIVFAILLLIGGLLTGYNYYRKIFQSNVAKYKDQKEYLYIPTGATFDDLLNIIKQQELLINTESFAFTAELMDYNQRVKPGKYKLKEGMNNRQLVGLLKSGMQEPVKLTFNGIRLQKEFTEILDEKLEFKAAELNAILNDKDYLATYNLTPKTAYTMFIPNTYELYWNTDAETFFKKMNKEYEKFWNEERDKKAEELKMTRAEVTILASIVNQETNKKDEMPTVAGVYLNRLFRDMKLEADPTVIFAVGDFTIKRVRGKMMSYDSPYNTYFYKGLPPGPITMPSTTAIDAVLNRQSHNYIFMCAKEDFSGYHNFAENFNQHLVNARKFQRALDQRGI